jgi:hypothetical protein
MVLSFLGWCWALRPMAPAQGDPQATTALPSAARLAGALLVALLAAWATALLVNAARILVIVRWQPVLAHGLPAGDAHRLLGLLAYLPALALQGWLVERERPARALLVAGGVYAGLMLGVPLLTGNALANPRAYAHHALYLLAALAPVLLLVAAISGLPLAAKSVQDRWQSWRGKRGSHEVDRIGSSRGVARVPRGCGRR